MADNENNMSQQPQLCKQGCGFYGNPNFDGMCSKCYKDYVQRKSNTTGVVGRASPNPNANSDRASSLSAAFVNAVSSSAPSGYTVEDMRALIKQEAEESRIHSAVSVGISANVDTSSALADVTKSDTLACADLAKIVGTGTNDSASPQAADANGGQPLQAVANAGSAQKPSNRCDTCKKKVGLTGFGCRCGGTFCGEHRYSDRHACPFDYKQHGAQQLRKLNPVVIADKVTKI